MADQQVVLNVSKDIIDAHVRAAVASVLGKDPSALVAAVVNAAMNQTENYGRTTIWETQVNKMIREVADATLKAWIDEQRPNIERAVRARLDGKDRKDLIKAVCDKLVGGLGGFKVHLSLPGD